MDRPQTRAGQWLLDRSQWEDGLRAFRVRINATAGPDDMHRHILAIEAEARNTLDEGRLARALDAHFEEARTFGTLEHCERYCMPAIAKAYRENAG